MNRKKNKMKKVWKGAAIAALSVLAIGAGATGALRVKADETAAIKPLPYILWIWTTPPVNRCFP